MSKKLSDYATVGAWAWAISGGPEWDAKKAERERAARRAPDADPASRTLDDAVRALLDVRVENIR